MSEISPISCISCRRKKIKCNKKKTCNQCIKRNIPCEFPSTFRNIRIKEQISSSSSSQSLIDPQPIIFSTLAPPHPMSSESSVSVSLKYDNQTSGQFSNRDDEALDNANEVQNSFLALRNELEFLKSENLQLLQDNIKLNQQLTRFSSGQNEPIPLSTTPLVPTSLSENPISMSAPDVGEKYYSSQSPFIMDSMKDRNDQMSGSLIQKDGSLETPTKHSYSPNVRVRQTSSKRQKLDNANITNPDIYMAENTSSSSDSKSLEWERQNDNSSQASLKENTNLVERSLSKKSLPMLVLNFIKHDDPELSSDSETLQDLQKSNYSIIKSLVGLFFELNNYYASFISKKRVIDFLDSYQDIKDKEWEHDDDLLVLYMILLLVIQRLTPRDFVELEVLPFSSIHLFKKFRSYLTNNVLFHNFEKLKRNLINESLLTIQAYILCTEFHFLEQRYEESWSTMFHTCSIAYSIGLHVMGKVRTGNSSSSSIGLPRGSSTESTESSEKESKEDSSGNDSNDEEEDITRFKVWFALKNLTSQVCSILGRPNPISIQVNHAEPLSIKRLSNSLKELYIHKDKTHILLKIGLSECLRLSTLMLIESFMTEISVEDLLKLDETFNQEIKQLEMARKVIKNKRSSLSFDAITNLQKEYDEVNLLMDLTTLHINRAKLFEPFMNRFENTKQYEKILKCLVDSICKSLNLLITFIQNHLKIFGEKRLRLNDNSWKQKDNVKTKDMEKDLNNLVKFGRIFRGYFPFLNSFIYQIIIVIFTFLHYKFKDFIINISSSVLNNRLLKRIEEKLNSLLRFDTIIETTFKNDSKMWPPNILYLINKVLIYIKAIYRKQGERKLQETEERNQKNRSQEDTKKIWGHCFQGIMVHI
ncbi:uncharacterized protein RJT21DRAFT_114803 [Scheffersomyces amazonensis]|uniref:uncharacterized protein n=1 Tax=Scheffersomyces amazonensis TaxID=1078765 RepID=UPI00315D62D7